MFRLARCWLSLVGSCCACAFAAAQAPVFVVAPTAGPGVDFTSLGTAVAGVPEGATILVKPGSYASGAAISKSLTIVADDGAIPVIAGSIGVTNLSVGQRVVIHGLKWGPPTLWSGSPGLLVSNCAGDVFLSECSIHGGAGNYGWSQPGTPQPGARIEAAAAVTFVDCSVTGGGWANLLPISLSGAHGIHSKDSNVSVHGGSLSGGNGSSNGYWNGYGVGSGGAAGTLDGGTFFAERTKFVGVPGDFCCSSCGPFGMTVESPAGAGVVLWTNNPIGDFFGTTYEGVSGCGTLHTSTGGYTVVSGTATALLGTPRAFSIPSPMREGSMHDLLFSGLAGDLAVLGLSLAPAQIPVFDLLSGMLQLGAPLDVVPIGVLDPAGNLSWPVKIPELGAGVASFQWRVQAAFVSADLSTAVLADPAAPVLLDSAY